MATRQQTLYVEFDGHTYDCGMMVSNARVDGGEVLVEFRHQPEVPVCSLVNVASRSKSPSILFEYNDGFKEGTTVRVIVEFRLTASPRDVLMAQKLLAAAADALKRAGLVKRKIPTIKGAFTTDAQFLRSCGITPYNTEDN